MPIFVGRRRAKGILPVHRIRPIMHEGAQAAPTRTACTPTASLRIYGRAASKSGCRAVWVAENAEIVLAANKEMVLDAIHGDSIALEIEIDPQESRWVRVIVLRSLEAQEETTIRFCNFDRRISIWYATPSQLVLDTTYSNHSPEGWIHPPEKAMLSRRDIKLPNEGLHPAEPLILRVMVDRNVVGVLANAEVFMAARVNPERPDSTEVGLQACGQDAILRSLQACATEFPRVMIG